MRTPRRHRGFSLIEALITLFVFAIGILTVAGLQLISKKANYDAAQRTTAGMLANDIAERMRANLANNGAALADYLVEDIGADPDTGEATLGQPGTDCTASQCTKEQMAAWDLYEWEQALVGASESNAGGLVEPNACIRSADVDGGAAVYHIIIAWRGVTPLSNPVIDQDLTGAFPNGCGEGSDKFLDDETGALDVYRRVIVVSTYITP
jgi:type IV pilus assembly protein PilV